MRRFKYTLVLFLVTIILFSGCNSSDNKKDNAEKKTKSESIVRSGEKYNYTKLKEDIDEFKKRYEQVKINTIGKSVEDRNLYSLKLGQGSKIIGVIGGVHGREYITSLVLMKMIENYILRDNIGNYNLSEILEKATFIFIPMLNPDGIEIAINGVSSNKSFYVNANEGNNDFKRWKANGRGVDLNKQFPADWEEIESKNGPHYDSYKGSTPLSEPESKALALLTRQEKFDAVVCFHNKGNVLFWYYNQQRDQYQRDYRLARQISEVSGHRIVEPEESDIKAAGYKDWVVKEFKKPGFTVEFGKGDSEKPLSGDNLNYYYDQNKKILPVLAENI
ncbi:MAG: M14 family zinc carboxypeptidase [Bacillota bacterium]